MITIPKISKALQSKYEGKSVAIANGKIVAVASDSFVAEKKAIQKGYIQSDIMTTFIMGKKQYVLSIIPNLQYHYWAGQECWRIFMLQFVKKKNT